MKNTILIALYTFFLLLAMSAPAQSLQKRVTLQYSNKKLGMVLDDISTNYDVNFSYSSHFVPVNQKVSVSVKDEPLSTALDDIVKQTGLIYAQIGSQIVLKMGNDFKQEGLSQINTLPKKIKQTSPIYPLTAQEQYIATLMKKERGQSVSTIEKTKIEHLSGGDSVYEANIEDYKLPPLQIEPEVESDRRLAQVSILPFVGTNALRSAEMTNNLSLNLFWGTNGGVDGVEVGGFVNTVRNDVKGVQVAGLGNTVGGDIVGTQVAGLFNTGNGHVQGVQAAGLFNVAGKTEAVQTAGLFNVTTGDFIGIQMAGLFNVSTGKADGMQTSGLFNIANGKTKTQLSGLFNIAKDVEIGQASAFLNVGKKVSGFQIALINIADSTSGVSLGLLNIIKKGYNRLEFAGGEALYSNLALKFGARSFYNIFQFGARWDNMTVQVNPTNGGEPTTKTGTCMSWALGYGIGTTVGFSPRTLMNIEVVSMHVNELERWTNHLNLLNQLRLTFDVRTGRRTSLFVGPVGNILISSLQRDNNFVSNIAPHVQYEETTGDTNVKMWVGFTAGIRL